MTDLVQALAEYGPWAVSALLATATMKLYFDLARVYESRVTELESILRAYHEDASEHAKAWQSMHKLLDDLRYELERRRRG